MKKITKIQKNKNLQEIYDKKVKKMNNKLQKIT